MRFRRSTLPLVLLLALLAGLGFHLDERNRSHEFSANSRDGSRPGNVPRGFGPLPTLAPSDDLTQVAAPPPTASLDGASEAMRTLAARMSRDPSGLEVVTHPDGRRSVNLDGRFMHMSATVPGADGNPVVRCYSNYHEMVADRSSAPEAASPPTLHHVR
jgi:hypothetical protein